MDVPQRQIRARFTAGTVTVYQAYSPAIAEPAVAAGRFVEPFSRGRMTWIKPSFHWMMYRSSWATLPGQERVLAIEISREGFEWALSRACLSHFDRDLYPSREAWSQRLRATCVRVQWDPERTGQLQPLPYRSLQVGLSGQAAELYADEWIVSIQDITPVLREWAAGERPYPLPAHIASVIGAAL